VKTANICEMSEKPVEKEQNQNKDGHDASEENEVEIIIEPPKKVRRSKSFV
jgi:hypothetical protein